MVIITKTNRRFITLRTRKTYQDDRMTYSYQFANGDKYTLEIDKDGITEADIKLLHSIDDNDITNKSGKDVISPMSAWLAVFPQGAIQDNDKNKVNTLQVANHPDNSLLNDQLVTIKKDGTISGAIAYKLTDLTTPVKLTAYKGIGGIELGCRKINIKFFLSKFDEEFL